MTQSVMCHWISGSNIFNTSIVQLHPAFRGFRRPPQQQVPNPAGNTQKTPLQQQQCNQPHTARLNGRQPPQQLSRRPHSHPNASPVSPLPPEAAAPPASASAPPDEAATSRPNGSPLHPAPAPTASRSALLGPLTAVVAAAVPHPGYATAAGGLERHSRRRRPTSTAACSVPDPAGNTQKTPVQQQQQHNRPHTARLNDRRRRQSRFGRPKGHPKATEIGEDGRAAGPPAHRPLRSRTHWCFRLPLAQTPQGLLLLHRAELACSQQKCDQSSPQSPLQPLSGLLPPSWPRAGSFGGLLL